MAGKKPTDQQSPGDTRPDSHLSYLLARVNHRLARAMDHGLQAEQITPTQFFALAHIAEAPGLSSADLARGLLTTPQAVSTLIKRLDTAGLIERTEAARGLAGTMQLTEAGWAKLESAGTVAIATEAAALSVISAADQNRVTNILRALLAGLEQASQ